MSDLDGARPILDRQMSAIESVLVGGDLSKLTPELRVTYYQRVCESLGLNPLTKPFDYITLNGKLTLYAKRDCTEQLRKINGVSVRITGREVIEGIYVVTASAKDKSGREDESTGAVNIKGLQGEALANAYMKAETKAKRRVTLSICGLGLLDETEVDSISGAQPPEPEIPKTAPSPVTALPKQDKRPNRKELGALIMQTATQKGIDPTEVSKLAAEMFPETPMKDLSIEQMEQLLREIA
jgi:hypothetical protein